MSHSTTAGVVLTVGEGDVGQLGLGPDTMERSRPGVVELPHKCIQVGHAYFFIPISELPQKQKQSEATTLHDEYII